MRKRWKNNPGSILEAETKAGITERVAHLGPEDKSKWGRLNCHRMVCHIADQIRMAAGLIQTRDESNVLKRQLLRRIVLAGKKAPRGKIRTAPEIDQALGSGTPPTSFNADRQAVLQSIEGFISSSPDKKIRHPEFGPMSKEEWGRLIYLHLDHHLVQFGA